LPLKVGAISSANFWASNCLVFNRGAQKPFQFEHWLGGGDQNLLRFGRAPSQILWEILRRDEIETQNLYNARRRR
jgi:hypothetical protein